MVIHKSSDAKLNVPLGYQILVRTLGLEGLRSIGVPVVFG